MKSGKSVYVLYLLIILIIVLLVILTKNTLKNAPKKTIDESAPIEKLEIKTYPDVNDECTFSVSYLEYGNITKAGCTGGYTRYDINDVILDGNNLKASVIYSDKEGNKTGVYVDDHIVIKKVDNIANIKFGVFDSKLFIYDKSIPNVLVFNSKGKIVYDLNKYLNKNKVKDLSTGDTYIKTKYLDENSFIFKDGSFEFNAITNNCSAGSKGSHYIIKYSKEKFEKPEFVELLGC